MQELQWTKRFQFKLTDGHFEFKEDEVKLEHGVLYLIFKAYTEEGRVFRCPQDPAESGATTRRATNYHRSENSSDAARKDAIEAATRSRRAVYSAAWRSLWYYSFGGRAPDLMTAVFSRPDTSSNLGSSRRPSRRPSGGRPISANLGAISASSRVAPVKSAPRRSARRRERPTQCTPV